MSDRGGPSIAEFDATGFAVVEDVVPGELLIGALDAFDELVDRSRGISASNDVFDLGPGHLAARPRLRRIKSPVANHEAFAAIMRSPVVLDVVEAVVGPDIRFQASKLNVKEAGGGTAVEWHQDYPFGPCSNDDIVTVGVALDHADADNGCLLMVPGSHRGPIHDHHRGRRFVGAVSPDLPELASARPVPVTTGSLSVHHCRTLHASAPNRSGRPRRLLLFQYSAADAYPLGPVSGTPWATLEEYDAALVRGVASGTARCVDLKVAMPRYEGAAGSIYELQTRADRTWK